MIRQKELEKTHPSLPADQSDPMEDKPNPTLDQNSPMEHEQPSLNEESKSIHLNFSKPEKNEQGHPIPVPIGEDDIIEDEEEDDTRGVKNDKITKGKQILDTEESNLLLIGNSTNKTSNRLGANRNNGFSQGPSFLGHPRSSNVTVTNGKRKPFRTMLSKLDSSGFRPEVKTLTLMMTVCGLTLILIGL